MKIIRFREETARIGQEILASDGAQRVLDALHDRIVGVDARVVGSRAPDEQVRYGRGRVGPAQDFESLEGGALVQR